MVLFTMIARLADGLPLAATMQEDEQVNFFILILYFELSLYGSYTNDHIDLYFMMY